MVALVFQQTAKVSFHVHSAKVFAVGTDQFAQFRFFEIIGSLTEYFPDGTSYNLKYKEVLYGETQTQYEYNPSSNKVSGLPIDAFGPGATLVIRHSYCYLPWFANEVDNLFEGAPDSQNNSDLCSQLFVCNYYWLIRRRSDPSSESLQRHEAAVNSHPE